MALVRRWSSFIFFAACFLIIFYRIRSPPRPTQLAQPHDKPPNGRFKWKDVPVRNPVSSYIPLPTEKPLKLPKIQFDFQEPSKIEKELRDTRRAEVKKAFQRCWKSYREKAWLKDELDPVDGGYHNNFGGWAATLVDSLDTLWIMDLKEEFKEAVEAVKEIDFTTSTVKTVNIFETTIRYLGGLLAAYDLSKEQSLLDKAIEVADMIYVAFDTPNRLPISRWKWAEAAKGTPQVAPDQILLAEIGSLSMELTHLSQITGDPKWYDAVARIYDALEREQNNTKLPGMWPITINAETEDFSRDTSFTLASMADSAYEYLPKMHALLGGTDQRYEKMYKASMATAIKHTIFRPMTPDNDDILIAGFSRSNGGSVDLDPQVQHLVCFTGGMFAIAGKLFALEEHVEIGQKLTNGCVWVYKSFPYGIMPEISHVIKCDSLDDCPWSEERWHSEVLRRAKLFNEVYDAVNTIAIDRLPKGFSQVDDRSYILRPEAIESVFIMYRTKGEQAMQAAAWDMFTAIEKYTSTDLANSALSDVTVSDSIAPKKASMESFWLAETLKYFYLMFSDPNVISLDDYVFNTEAHPFRRPS